MRSELCSPIVPFPGGVAAIDGVAAYVPTEPRKRRAPEERWQQLQSPGQPTEAHQVRRRLQSSPLDPGSAEQNAGEIVPPEKRECQFRPRLCCQSEPTDRGPSRGRTLSAASPTLTHPLRWVPSRSKPVIDSTGLEVPASAHDPGLSREESKPAETSVEPVIQDPTPRRAPRLAVIGRAKCGPITHTRQESPHDEDGCPTTVDIRSTPRCIGSPHGGDHPGSARQCRDARCAGTRSPRLSTRSPEAPTCAERAEPRLAHGGADDARRLFQQSFADDLDARVREFELADLLLCRLDLVRGRTAL